MIYIIHKITGRIGTMMEKTEASFTEMQQALNTIANQTSIAAFDNQTNTIHVFNDQVIDLSSIVQKFKNYCDLPNKHQFSIVQQQQQS